jgi:hypothetical protein
LRKPTDRSFLEPDEDLDGLTWITVGMVFCREKEGILVVVGELVRIGRGLVAVVTVMGAKGVRNAGATFR